MTSLSSIPYFSFHFISASLQSITVMANQPERLADAQIKDAGEKAQGGEEKPVVETVPSVEEGTFVASTIR